MCDMFWINFHFKNVPECLPMFSLKMEKLEGVFSEALDN